MKDRIEQLQQHATPYYFYNLELLRETLGVIQREAGKYNYHIHYALKANSNSRVLNEINKAGLGADCVSGNEVLKAVETGFSSKDIVLAGVGKTDQEIEIGLDHDIFCFNCESLQELEVIDEIATKKGKIARVAIRINPNVSADTHKYITTGLQENKFGIKLWELDKVIELLKSLNHIEFVGIHFHIGSQILNLNSFKNLCIRINEIQQTFVLNGLHCKHINVGGGLGINYQSPEENPIAQFEDYFALFNEFLELREGQEVHFELGRSVVGNCGDLIAKVIYVKEGKEVDFLILDAGMTELIRPALYQSYHKIENISSTSEEEKKYDVVGPICETSDCFGKSIELPISRRGDYIRIRSAGAYGQIMASEYNLRTKAKAIYSDDLNNQ